MSDKFNLATALQKLHNCSAAALAFAVASYAADQSRTGVHWLTRDQWLECFSMLPLAEQDRYLRGEPARKAAAWRTAIKRIKSAGCIRRFLPTVIGFAKGLAWEWIVVAGVIVVVVVVALRDLAYLIFEVL